MASPVSVGVGPIVTDGAGLGDGIEVGVDDGVTDAVGDGSWAEPTRPPWNSPARISAANAAQPKRLTDVNSKIILQRDSTFYGHGGPVRSTPLGISVKYESARVFRFTQL